MCTRVSNFKFQIWLTIAIFSLTKSQPPRKQSSSARPISFREEAWKSRKKSVFMTFSVFVYLLRRRKEKFEKKVSLLHGWQSEGGWRIYWFRFLLLLLKISSNLRVRASRWAFFHTVNPRVEFTISSGWTWAGMWWMCESEKRENKVQFRLLERQKKAKRGERQHNFTGKGMKMKGNESAALMTFASKTSVELMEESALSLPP